MVDLSAHGGEDGATVYFTEEANPNGGSLRQKNKSVFERLYNKKVAGNTQLQRAATEMQISTVG